MMDEIPRILLILTMPGTDTNIKTKVMNENRVSIQGLIHRLVHTNRGRIFWIVERKNKILNEQVFKIEINQPWRGAAPSFMNILRVPISKKYSGKKLIISLDERKIIEATDWTKKYFIVFSNDSTP